jgi:hypothetical protein
MNDVAGLVHSVRKGTSRRTGRDDADVEAVEPVFFEEVLLQHNSLVVQGAGIGDIRSGAKRRGKEEGNEEGEQIVEAKVHRCSQPQS